MTKSLVDRGDGPSPTHARERLSVVVPTRNERENVHRLLGELRPMTGHEIAEVIFVDDSDDDTCAVIEDAGAGFPVPVRCIHRPPDARGDGLSGAVVVGMRAAASPLVGVLDADLQHPPEVLSRLREAVSADGDDPVDLAYGTRYADGGQSTGLGSRWRALASRASRVIAKALFPRRLRGVTDPMGGLFVVRRDAIELGRLRPTGFKILLELLLRNDLRTTGVGYGFRSREAGSTKASVRVAITYLVQLLTLRAGIGRLGRGVGFALVGASGLVVNSVALWALVDLAGLGYGLGAVLATQVSTVWNYLLLDLLVFRSSARADRSGLARFGRFWAINNVLLLLRVPLLALLASGFGVHYLLANVLTFAFIYLLRFLVSDKWVWASGLEVESEIESAYRHTYDVAGIVTVASEVELRELARFSADIPLGAADIELRSRVVGSRRPSSPKVVVSAGQVSYTEHLGGLFANFTVDTSGPIDIRVSPVLARSPHVVYTNIVEALLRFLLVSRGCMLLHSATMELDGVGIMLSARTDTGKTGTVLRLVRERQARFLSDDMTIIRPDGTALAYPKPMTISAHTLAAVAASPLRRVERCRLAVQSRIHSKQGRSLGAWLAQRNLPIMAFNAVTQFMIPPPKYHVETLVATEHCDATKVSDIFVIERGDDRVEDIDGETARRELLENTDDAYGFPPFEQFAPAISIGGDGYLTLRAKEEAILGQFLRSARVRRLCSTGFTWADDIPRLISGSTSTSPSAPEPGHAATGATARVIDLRDPVPSSTTKGT